MSLTKILYSLLDKQHPIYKRVMGEVFAYYVGNKNKCQDNSIYILSVLKEYLGRVGVENELALNVTTNLVEARYIGMFSSIEALSRMNLNAISVIEEKLELIGEACIVGGLSIGESLELYNNLKDIDRDLLNIYLHEISRRSSSD